MSQAWCFLASSGVEESGPSSGRATSQINRHFSVSVSSPEHLGEPWPLLAV